MKAHKRKGNGKVETKVRGNRGRTARLAAAFLAALVAATLAVAVGAPASAWAANASDGLWTVSKSKTATNLDEDYTSQVTLSLPSAEEQLVSDVVFVLDKSTSAELEDQALNMLSELKTQVEKTNAKVNVGVVIFNKEAHASEFMDLATQYSAIEAAIKQNISSGTNTHAGLLAGKAMLDNDTSVSADRKCLIFVSDGITYMYNAEPTATAWNFNQPNARDDWYGSGSWGTFTGPDNWYSKYHTNNAPDNWGTWLAEVGQKVSVQGETYDYPYGGTATTSTAQDINNWDKDYAMSIDKALYLTNEVYQEAKTAGYHCYAMTAATSSGTQYTWGPSFVNYLADGQAVNFSQIKNDILYLLDAGSKVEDYMGYVAGDDGYNFDFVNDASALSMKVGDKAISAVKIADNKYGFAANAEGGYDYILEYVPGDKAGSEHFVWTINVPVSNFAPVQLTYSVQLVNPSEQAGTYGAFDANGSKGYAGLYTNNSATLYPVNSFEQPGTPELFPMPTVSYTVAEKPVVDEPVDNPADNPVDPQTPVESTETPVKGTPLAQTGDPLSAALPFAACALAVCVGAGAFALRRMNSR